MEKISVEKLSNLGMQKNESSVYLALLEMGGGTVTEISRAAKLNRTTGYDILERLALDGLVSRSVSGKKKRIYAAEPPSRLKQYLENKKRKAERRLDELKDIFPDLHSLYKTELKPAIKFAEGKKEMIDMYMHKLEAKGVIYSILNLKGYSEDFDEMGQVSSVERYKRGVKEKCLALKNKTSLEWWEKVYGGKPKRQENTQYRWLDAEMKEYPNGEVNIFDDKVIIMLTKPGEYTAFEIQSQSFAAFLKIVFELAWKNASNKIK